jgi:cytochrome c oxidase assembly factor CtaG
MTGAVVPLSRLASDWEVSPAVLFAVPLALALFGQAFARLRRRGRTDRAGSGRALLFLLGVALATLAVVSPLDEAGERYLLSAHMLQHLLLGDVAPALLVVALRGPLVFFLLPRQTLRPLARARPLRLLLSFLLRPRVSFSAWALAFGAWHVPAAYDAALRHPLVHELEHACFVLAGLLVWTQLIDPARHGRLRVGQRAAYALALFAAGQVLAELLIFSGPLYPAYAAQPDRLLGLSPAADQTRAGLLMMAEQIVTLGSCAAILLRRYLDSLGLPGAAEPQPDAGATAEDVTA